MRRRRNCPPRQSRAPHVGCNAYVRRSDGGAAPNLVRRYGKLCAAELRGWSARVARRAGSAGTGACERLPHLIGWGQQSHASAGTSAAEPPTRTIISSAPPRQAASAQPCAAAGHGPAAPNAKVQPHAAPTQLRPRAAAWRRMSAATLR
jgi:hypothetical protein